MELLQIIATNFAALRDEIARITARCGRDPASVTIVAVAKGHTPEHIEAATRCGITNIGENYAQELRAKYAALRDRPIRWHFIGRLQTNKAKYVVPIAALVHSVDRRELAQELNRQAERCGKSLDILLQVNTSGEARKAGVAPEAAATLLAAVLELKHLRPRGLMTMAGLEHSTEQVRAEFRLLRTLRDRLATEFGIEQFTELSMGMSGDFPIAIEEGATLVRIGTRIFGERSRHLPAT
jgi:pyridoxal phosphate enzyme (YggS family)